ncbi:ABC transporter G family member 43-like [Oryza brachyantha]|uniref:ABC transporter G family member 43-like n=1 Tax=Oryza brachyantha TaxID=4533 RepID=UPI001ADBD054|nr:ABC transporter G family member 43-like [Oryza brachyantha]
MAAEITPSASRRSWLSSGAASLARSMREGDDPFTLSAAASRRDAGDDEENLRWAALEKLPTYDRMRRGILRKAVEGGDGEGGLLKAGEVDIANLDPREGRELMERVFKAVEDDNERFLRRFKDRLDRVGIELPQIEVRYEHLNIEADVYVGKRALPTLLNAAINTVEGLVSLFGSSNKRTVKILKDVNGIIKPSRMTLLLGPPSSGKSTFMRALTGKPDKNLKVSGEITYCGHTFSEFYPERTSAYVSQHDLHNPEMTVRETLDFSRRCLGSGARYDMLSELARREHNAGIKPDPEIDALMKATVVEGKQNNIVTDLVLKALGLDICADTIVGGPMIRGISGGQKKRVTTGEMLTGPATALFMDEISTGLDSSSTFQIVKYIRQVTHVMNSTVMMSLLQPPPETYALFDDIILISEGYIIYHGPRENILEFFERAGFRCPERKGVADFLQEVTSRKDQQQYWFHEQDHYRYVSVEEFAQYFKTFHVGQKLQKELQVPYDKSKTHPAALTTKKYGLSNRESLKAVLSREWLLMKRNSFLFIFKAFQLLVLGILTMTLFLRTKMPHEKFSDTQKFVGALTASLITIMFNGFSELQLTIKKLPIFYKQRDFLFFPAWTFGLANIILKVPLSIMESTVWIVLTYYVVGFAPAAGRFFRQYLAFFCTHQMALGLFRLLGAVLRSMVVANTFGMFVLLLVFIFGGILITRKNIKPWWIWGYWTSPMMYSNNALSVNEFLADRWAIPNNDRSINATTIGKAFLQSRGYFTEEWGYWLSIGAMIGFMIIFNVLYICALTFLRPLGGSNAVVSDDAKKNELDNQEQMSDGTSGTNGTENRRNQRGMVLPFQPLTLSFNHVNYYVDMPAEMQAQGFTESRLQLLSDISGAFRPGVLTALVGVSGAGKTTLMDVLAGRKTTGMIEGDIKLSGYPKKQETFARISGYCEQTDIHSPNLTVYESLVFSAWLRLSSEVDENTRKVFVEEVMSLVELDVLRDALVGLPGVSGLSTEQRKRLTIAVELVANPSIIFMDEPTSGLDARAAAIVMRTVRNTVNTGRTVVCTIHQPSIDIFEAFDELLLLKRGGRVIYAGQLGLQSHVLVEYFEAIPGVPKITEGYNPATWMLEVSSTLAEARLNIDFAEVYASSALYRSNQELIGQLSVPPPGLQDLSFPTKYSQNFLNQCVANTWKQFRSYWKDPPYNAMRYLMTLLYGLVFGTLFWRKGKNVESETDLYNLLGATYAAVFFLGAASLLTLLPVVSIERTVFYREKAAGMYSPLSYAFGQGFVEFCYSAVQGALYTILIYSLVGYEWKAAKFFYFMFFMIGAFSYFTLFSMMLISCTPSEMLAGILVSFVLTSWNNFAGFIITRPLIPVWWKWFYWANPVSWTIYGVIASQFADSDRVVSVPGQSTTVVVKDYLKDNMGYEHDFLGYVVLAHFGYIILFFFLFGYGIKYLNFQKR